MPPPMIHNHKAGTRQPFICIDCKQEEPTLFMVKNDLWISVAEKRDILCIDCFEHRLGRPILPDDLLDCGVTRVMKLGVTIYSRKGNGCSS